jgi:predicted permease
VETLIANDTEFEGVPRSPDGPAHNVDYYTAASDGYLQAMGIDVVEGRGFDPADAASQAPVLLVNQALARTFYPGQSPVGRRIRPSGSPVPFTVIGVVADVKQAGLGAPAGTELFFFHPQVSRLGGPYRTMSVVLKTQGDPEALAPALERVVRELDPTLPVSDVRTMEETVARSMASPRFLAFLLGVFAVVAILLAGVGTYSVMAYTVGERTREMGVRLAMGAEASSVRGLVLRQAGALALVGVGAGTMAALALSRFLASRLFEVGPTDPVTLAAAPLFLTAVALGASYVPARRASILDPAAALRSE